MDFLDSVGLNLEDMIPQVGLNLEDFIPQEGEFEFTEEVPMEEASHFPDDYDEYGGDVYVHEEEEDPLPQVDEEYPQQPENQPANQQNQRVQQVNRGYAPRQANQRNQRVQQVNRGYAPRQANQQNQRRPANRNYASQPPVGQAYSGMNLQDMYPQMIEVAGNLMDEENNCTDEHEYDDIPVVDEEDHFAEETIEDEEYDVAVEDDYPQQPETENQQDPLQQANQQNQCAPMNPQSQRTRMNQQSQQERVNQQSQRARMNQQSQQAQGNRQSQRSPMNQQIQQPRVNQQGQQPQVNQQGQQPQVNQQGQHTQGNRPRQPAPMNQQNQQPRVNQQGQQPRANQQGPRTPVNQQGQRTQQNQQPTANQQNQFRVHPSTPANQATQSPVPARGYPLAVPQGQGAWSTEILDCLNDAPLFCLTCWCPCITFGRIAEIVDKGSSTCSTAGGIYTLILLFTGCQFIYSGAYRTKMRLQYGIPGDDAQDFCTHFWCESCSLVQEYKELTARGYDVPLGWHGNINLARQKQAQGIQMAPKAPNGMTR